MSRPKHTDSGSDSAFRAGAPRERTVVRDNLESIVIAILLVVFARQFVVEAFRIRHGSMAPTLVGIHREIRCPNCGWVFNVGIDKVGYDGKVECVNCRYDWPVEPGGAGRRSRVSRLAWLWSSGRLEEANRIPGHAGRIFVNKFLYSLRRPERWEVIVFLHEHDLRCRLCDWRWKAKTLEEARCPECGGMDFDILETRNFIKRVVGLPDEKVTIRDGDVYADGRIARKPRFVQRQFWKPAFDSLFVPQREVVPAWDVSAEPERWLHHPPGGVLAVDARGYQSAVMAAFEPDIMDYYAYDGLSYELSPRRFGAAGHNLVGDCRIRAKTRLLAAGRDGGEVLLAIKDAGHEFTVSFPAGRQGEAVLYDGAIPVRQTPVAGLRTGESQWIVLENYDDRIVVRWGDAELLSYEYEGTEARQRGVQFGAGGATVLWERIVIERDIYYTNVTGDEAGYDLADGEYFVLGDNSPASSDSRRWDTPGVPRKNIIGRAFFVFWPTHHMKWLVGGEGE